MFSFAQKDEGQEMIPISSGDATDKYFKYSVEGGAGFTYALANPAFLRDYSNGIYSANLALNASITKRFYIGVEGHNDQFGQALPLYGIINPVMNLYMGGARIGYNSSTGSDFLFNVCVTGGEAEVIYRGAPIAAPKGGFKQQSTFGIFNIMEMYRIQDQFWVGFYASITYLPYVYNPYYTGVGQYYPYVPSDYSGPTTYIAWGLQVFYTFGKK